MFSFQFGTFESSTPGWFNWLSFGGSLAGIIASVFIARHIFNIEKKQRKEASDELRSTITSTVLPLISSLKKAMETNEDW